MPSPPARRLPGQVERDRVDRQLPTLGIELHHDVGNGRDHDLAERPTTGDVDLTATGTASGLYLLFWNRTPDDSVSLAGDTDLMEFWNGRHRVRWSGGE